MISDADYFEIRQIISILIIYFLSGKYFHDF